MKEIDPLHQDNTRDEQKQLQERKQGQKHIPTGLKVWVIDPKTEQPEQVHAKAAIKTTKVLATNGEKNFGVEQVHLKVENNPEHYYCMAINQKNALRKYFKSQFYAAYRRRNPTPADPPRTGP